MPEEQAIESRIDQANQDIPTPTSDPNAVPPAEDPSDEIKQRARQQKGFWDRLLPPKDDVKPEATPTDAEPSEPKAPEPKTPEPKAADGDEEPAAKAKKRRKPVEKPEPDPIAIARETGNAIAEGLSQHLRPPAPVKAEDKDPFEVLPDDFHENREIFREMVSLFPDKYKSLGRQLQDYATRESQYIEQWERDNPAQVFDGEAPEHDGFYQKIQPKFSERDFERAKTELIERRAEQRVMAKVSPRLDQLDNERRVKQLEPTIASELLSLVQDVTEDISPENRDLADKWDTLPQLEEKNPIAAEVIVHVHNRIRPLIDASYRIFNGVEPYNESNPVHRALADRSHQVEQRIMQLPASDRLYNGKQFATLEKYVKMSADEQSRHWYLGAQELAEVLRGEARKAAKEIYNDQVKKFETWKTKTATAPKTAPANGQPNNRQPTPKADRSSPSISGRSTLPTDTATRSSGPRTGQDNFWNRMLR